MKLEFVTLAGVKIQSDVYELILPTAEGDIAVYPNYEPTIVTVAPGVIAVRHKKQDSDSARDIFATNGGVAEITNDKVRLLVDEADHSDEIVQQEAAEALAAAKKLKEEAKDELELERAEALVDRHAVRLKVAELRRGANTKTPKID